MKNQDYGSWIWKEKWSQEDQGQPGVVYFRKTFSLSEKPEQAVIKITADTRYKLYVNGKLVQLGPSRGDHHIWFVDTVDIGGSLRPGANVIVVSVLRYPEDTRKGNHGMFRTKTPGLYLSGRMEMPDGEIICLASDSTWKCRKDEKLAFVREEERFAPLIIHEQACGVPELLNWKEPDYDDSEWESAWEYPDNEVEEILRPENLATRTIPFVYRKQRGFAGIMESEHSIIGEDAWKRLAVSEETVLTIPPHTTEEIVLDAGEEMTGYLYTDLCGGALTQMEYLYAECYVQDETYGPAGQKIKKDRLDKRNGHLEGYTDHYTVCGSGTKSHPETYAPYWFRTFRFIRIRIKTAEKPLTIRKLFYEETGYPLEVKTTAETSDASLSDIWDISLRTLRRCMHETYVDCPYYEQLQYAMDSRQEILYTYAVSADDRLARKCMDDLRRSQRPDGLLNCCYPNCNSNVIPGFPIYYILMVYDHMMYFGDKELVAGHLPAIEKILGFFHCYLDEKGYVGKIGGVIMTGEYWSFIDWAPQWDETSGMPPAGVNGPITAESLLYLYGLQHAAKLCGYVGQDGKAAEFEAEASRVQKALRTFCMEKDGFLMDGPGVRQYSQFTQVLGILTDTLDIPTGKKILQKTLREKENFAQCTIATAMYLFAALRKTGLYAETEHCWDKWREMIANHCTTSIESEYARSECHAWGALALYELPSVILGVTPAEPGYRTVRIAPESGYLTHASGKVKTPVGDILVSWKLEDGRVNLHYAAPEGVKVITGND